MSVCKSRPHQSVYVVFVFLFVFVFVFIFQICVYICCGYRRSSSGRFCLQNLASIGNQSKTDKIAICDLAQIGGKFGESFFFAQEQVNCSTFTDVLVV